MAAIRKREALRSRKATARRRTYVLGAVLLACIAALTSFFLTYGQGGKISLSQPEYAAPQLLIHQFGNAEQEGSRWVMLGTVSPAYKLWLKQGGINSSPPVPGYAVYDAKGEAVITVQKRWFGLFWVNWATIDLGTAPAGLPKLAAQTTEGFSSARVEFEAAFARHLNEYVLGLAK